MLYMTCVFILALTSTTQAFPGVEAKTALQEVSNLQDCRVKLHGMTSTSDSNEKNWRNTEKKLLEMEKYFKKCREEKEGLQEKYNNLMMEKGFAPKRKGLFEFVMTVGKILTGSPEATKEKWRSEFETEQHFSSSKTLCCFDLIQTTFFTIMESVISSVVSFMKSPLHTITGIWTRAENVMDVAANLLDLMILIIVLNALALGVLEIRKLFQGLKRIGGLLWNMPIIVIIKKLVKTTMSALGPEKDDKEPSKLDEMKVLLENMKKEHEGKIDEMIKTQEHMRKKQDQIGRNYQEPRYVPPQRRSAHVEELSGIQGRRTACIYCGQTNHSSEKCWKEFGYPQGNRGRSPMRQPPPPPSLRSTSPVRNTIPTTTRINNVQENN